MNANTAITTAARKIATTTNARNSETKLHFDADGQLLDSHAKDMWYTTRQDWADQLAVSTIGAGRGHMTYREAQDLLDAAATDDAGYYLQQLADERNAEADR